MSTYSVPVLYTWNPLSACLGPSIDHCTSETEEQIDGTAYQYTLGENGGWARYVNDTIEDDQASGKRTTVSTEIGALGTVTEPDGFESIEERMRDFVQEITDDVTKEIEGLGITAGEGKEGGAQEVAKEMQKRMSSPNTTHTINSVLDKQGDTTTSCLVRRPMDKLQYNPTAADFVPSPTRRAETGSSSASDYPRSTPSASSSDVELTPSSRTASLPTEEVPPLTPSDKYNNLSRKPIVRFPTKKDAIHAIKVWMDSDEYHELREKTKQPRHPHPMDAVDLSRR